MLCWLKHIGLNHLNRNWLLKFDTINRLQSTLWIFSHGGSHEDKQGGQFDTVYTFGTHSFFYSSPCHWHFGVLQCVCVCVCVCAHHLAQWAAEPPVLWWWAEWAPALLSFCTHWPAALCSPPPGPAPPSPHNTLRYTTEHLSLSDQTILHHIKLNKIWFCVATFDIKSSSCSSSSI